VLLHLWENLDAHAAAPKFGVTLNRFLTRPTHVYSVEDVGALAAYLVKTFAVVFLTRTGQALCPVDLANIPTDPDQENPS